MEGQKECVAVPAQSRAPGSLRRKAWALSRDSYQASDSQCMADGEEEVKLSPLEETGQIPSKIASWLKDCKTPLGASLDEPNHAPAKGLARNGCSFEDDLSLGAEANHLQPVHTTVERPCFNTRAQEKRNQFQQKGRSMNSTGSCKSSTTVSSVSELLDLYEEDPEEILYNLGFGTDEPDIGSKVPPRFFTSTSFAKGIDFKVYLGAQLQRMELENPSYALTSRFRQVKVLTTVANAFGVLYSQVSGLPVQRFGDTDGDREAKEHPPLKRNNSALNVAKMLKKTLTRLNLQNPAGDGHDALSSSAPSTSPTARNLPVEDGDPDQELRGELRQQKRTPPTLATVAEEASCGPIAATGLPDVAAETEPAEGEKESCPDEEHPLSLTKPQFSRLVPQAKDSFEMEEVPPSEVQSIEGDTLPRTCSTGKVGSNLLRSTSQHSDSSGFAEDPPLDAIANPLKVQQSSDSCDSEVTVKEPPQSLSDAAFQELQDEDILTAVLLGDSLQLLPENVRQTNNVPWVMEQFSEPSQNFTPTESEPCEISKSSTQDESRCTEEPVSSNGPSIPDHTGLEAELDFAKEPCSNVNINSKKFEEVDSTFVDRGKAELRIQRGGRIWVKPQDLLFHRKRGRQRFPLRRSRSLPTSLLSPTRVVSSVRIKLRSGVPHDCTPPSFSYCYTPEEEEAEDGGDEEEDQGSCRSVLVINRPSAAEAAPSTVPHEPLHPAKRAVNPLLHFPPHLTQSSCSLCSTPPPDWPPHNLGDHSRAWSSSSILGLQPHSAAFRGPHVNPPTAPQAQIPPYGVANSNPDSIPYSSPNNHLHNLPLHTTPLSDPFNIPFGFSNSPQAAFSSGPHVPTAFSVSCNNLHNSQYSFSCSNLYNNSPNCGPYSSSCHSMHGGPCGPSWNCPQSAPYPSPHPSFHPHPWDMPSEPLRTTHSPSSTELQLRRVLQEIRGSVQNLSQMHREETGAQRPTAELNEARLLDLQGTRRGLHAFRTEMTELELALVRQQSLVYQHLNPEERREAIQLQQLRSLVRQELQELELQLEDRLLSLDSRLPASHPALWRHPEDLRWRESTDSLPSTSVTNTMEPVSQLLMEQLQLKADLGYQGDACEEASLCSSRSASPGRSRQLRHQARDLQHHLSPADDCTPSQPSIYKASISLTPAPPPRPSHMPTPDPPEPPKPMPSSPLSGSLLGTAENTREGRGAAEGAMSHPHLDTLLKEIKDSIAEKVRQEIVNELIAVMSPNRSPPTTGESV